MAALFGEFDDAQDGEVPGPLLPPEDRLWRHPSEMSGEAPAIDQQLVRRRWQQSEPSRASAWTAGLVGAVLATGLVALGTHLAPAFTGAKPSSSIQATVTSAPIQAPTATITPDDLSRSLQTSVAKVGASLAIVEAGSGAVTRRALGVIVRSNGTLVVPAWSLRGATSVMVLLGDDMPYVAKVIGSDASSGISILQVNGVDDLSAVSFDTASPPAAGSYAIAVTAPNGTSISAGSVIAPSFDASTPLVDPMLTDLPSTHCPLGSVLVDSKGDVTGIVTGEDGAGTFVTPAFLISAITAELLATGRVDHGWLGINATTSKGGDGVQVLSVDRGSAGAKAGLRPGDVIRKLDGSSVSSMAELLGRLYTKRPLQKVSILVLRSRRPVTLTAMLGASSG